MPKKAHTDKCRAKLDVLLEQRKDLTEAIDTLLDDIEAGRKYMKVYRQMKMYNDPSTNPVLYGKKGVTTSVCSSHGSPLSEMWR